MTEQIGAYDFVTLHVLPNGGIPHVYERKLQLIVVSSTGEPRRIIPEGVGYQSWHRFKTSKSDRIVRGWVLVPVHVKGTE